MNNQISELKKQILEEFGLITYMEKKGIKDDNDLEFLRKELKKIKTQKKYQLMSGFFSFLAIITFVLSFIFETKQIVFSSNIIIRSAGFIICLVMLFYSVYNAIENQKKESLYKILFVFSRINNPS